MFRAAEQFAIKRGFKPATPTFFAIEVDRFESITAHSLEEFKTCFDSLPKHERISSTQRFSRKDAELWVEVKCSGNGLNVSTQCGDADLVRLLHEQLRSDFGLQKAPLPSADPRRAIYPQPTAFLGRHFDDRAGRLAAKIREFLRLLGIEAVEGEGYEAGQIPAKVESLIDGREMYIGLVTRNPEHDWIIAEVGYARGKGKHIIVIVEEDANFNPTILGADFEQIRFVGDQIEQSFTKLLLEFRSIGVRIA